MKKELVEVAWLSLLAAVAIIDYSCHLSQGRVPTLTRTIVRWFPWWIAMPWFSILWLHFFFWYRHYKN